MVIVGGGFDKLILDLPAAAIGEGQIVTVSYAVPTTGTVIEDTAGNDALPFTDRPVVNNSTVDNNTPPVLASAAVLASGDVLSAHLQRGPRRRRFTVPPASAFTVKADGSWWRSTRGNCRTAALTNSSWILPAAAIGEGQIVTVSYAVPTTGTVIEDTDGNDALPFTDRPVGQQLHCGPDAAGVG